MPTSSPDIAFRFMGPAHVGVIALTAVLPVVLSVLARKIGSAGITRAIALVICAVLLINEMVHWGYGIVVDGFGEFVIDYLPLHICGMALFILTFAVLTRNQIAYEIAYFWGLAGTLQAVVTPDLQNGFPSYDFVQYFITHTGIVTGVLFTTWAMAMRPSPVSVARTFVLTNLFMFVIGGVNRLLGSNYMFLCRPPEGKSPFFFLGWPWYIVFLEGVGLALILLLYLPFPLCDLLRRRRAERAGSSTSRMSR